MQFSNIFWVHIPNINTKICFVYKQKIRYKINDTVMFFEKHIQRLLTKIYRRRLKNAQPRVHIILSLLQRLEKFDNKCTESKIIAAEYKRKKELYGSGRLYGKPQIDYGDSSIAEERLSLRKRVE